MFSGQHSFEARDGSRYISHVEGLPTAQRQWELDQLVEFYKALQPKHVLEIGSEYGGTLWHWLKHADPGTKVVNVDTMHEVGEPEKLREIWQSWCRPGVSLETIVGRSQEPEIIQAVRDALLQVDFAFIDGDHHYEGARGDWINYGPMVRRGGIVAFHDLITPEWSPHIGIKRLWGEIRHAGYLVRELYANGDQDWGGIGLVFV